MTKENENEKPKFTICKGCNGLGTVSNWVMGLGDSPEECQRCKGTGRIEIRNGAK